MTTPRLLSRCERFHQNPTINPDSGRTIDVSARTYRNLVRDCGPPPNITTPFQLPIQQFQPPFQPFQPPKIPVQVFQPPRIPVQPFQPLIQAPIQPTIQPPTQPRIPIQLPVQPPRIPIQPPVQPPVQVTIQPPRIPVQPTQAPRIPVQPTQAARIPVQLTQPPRIPIQPPIQLFQPPIQPVQPAIQPYGEFRPPGYQLQGRNPTERDIIRKLSGIVFTPRNRNGDIAFYIRIDPNTVTVEQIKQIIMNKTRIEGVQIVIRFADPQHFDVMGYLMKFATPDFIRRLVASFGFTNLVDELYVFYNILWYLSGSFDRINGLLEPHEIAYMSGLSQEHLLSLFPEMFRNSGANHDKDALLYAALTLKSVTRRTNDERRYREVTQYPPPAVWGLFFYKFPDRNNSLLTPYGTIANVEKTPVEDIFVNANVNNVTNLMDRYGVVISPIRARIRAPEYILHHFLTQIADYDAVLTRSPNILPPPVITPDQTMNVLIDQLKQYTTRELIDAYEYDEPFGDRDQLIRGIIQDRAGAKWSWRHKYCKNDDTQNVKEFERHGDMNKDDPNDPTLSYGVRSNYRCYQVSELIEMFTQYPEEFRVPDINLWEQQGIDPTTRLPYTQQFPLESIRRLRTLLVTAPQRYHIIELLHLVDRKLAELTDVGRAITRLKTEYDAFTPEQQYLARLYIAWIFFYGNWMRFWKGPGNPWPYETHTTARDICIPASRDEHIFIQNQIVNALTNNYERDPILAAWIQRLPTVRYNFADNNVDINRRNVTDILTDYLRGDACMGFGGDIFLQTGYYLITNLLRLNAQGQLDTFLTEMLPALLEMERQIVDQQLAQEGELNTYIRETTARGGQIEDEIREKHRVLTERRNELNRGVLPLDRFEPNRVLENRHEWDRFRY